VNRLEIVTLGEANIRIDGRFVDGLSAHKARALLIYLATTEQQSRQVLVGLLKEDTGKEGTAQPARDVH